MPKHLNGWAWFDHQTATGSESEDDEDDGELAHLTARCFSGRDGERLLAHLRHLEGQRQLVAHLACLISRGKEGG